MENTRVARDYYGTLGVARDAGPDEIKRAYRRLARELCTDCTGSGCSPGTSTSTCDICNGSGEIQSVQRSFLGQVVTSRPCPKCRGFGEVIADPCRKCGGDGRVRQRRSVAVRIPAGVADGMRVRLAGQGEVGA